MTRPKARFKIGNRCKCKHPYAYRGEEPFTIRAIANVLSGDQKMRWAYILQYDDAKFDAIPVENEGGYEMELLKKVKKP